MAKNPQNGGLPAKKPFFGLFGQKWLFLAIFAIFCPVATGLKTPDLAKIGQNLQKGLKVPIRETGRGGFYINPSRRGPAVPQGVPPGTG